MFARLGTFCLLTALLAVPSFAKDKEDKVKDTDSVPEIAPLAAGALGLFVVGGLALMTTRRRHASVTSEDRH